MSLIERIREEQLKARKLRMSAVASLLTTLIGEVELVNKMANVGEITDALVVTVIKRFIKSINETIKAVGDNDPHVLGLIGEKMTLETFLPTQLTGDALKSVIESLVLETGGVAMGPIMSVLKTRFDGQYDGKEASIIVKSLLSG